MELHIKLYPNGTGMAIYFDRFSVDGAQKAAYEYIHATSYENVKKSINILKDELRKREELAKKVEVAKKLPKFIELSDGTSTDLSILVDPALKNLSLRDINEEIQKLKIFIETFELWTDKYEREYLGLKNNMD